jgi:serine phosphatase RsbU (regulator of sigma subunit)
MTKDIFYNLASKLRPDLKTLSGQRWMGAVADVITLLYTLPLALLGVAWLVAASDWRVIRQNWGFFLLLAVLIYLFNRLSFFLITEINTGGYANTDGALDGVILWTAVFLFGPTGLWVPLAWDVFDFLDDVRRTKTVGGYWNRVRAFSSTIATTLLATLVALAVYQRLGGEIPLSSFSLQAILPAMTAISIQLVLTIAIYSGYIAYVVWALKNAFHAETRPAIYFFLLAFVLPALAHPFAILAAGLYTQQGLGSFIFDMIGLLLVAFLARRLSHAAESNRQQSRQLQELEKLGRAILNSPPDASRLPEILETHVPPMFAARGMAIWVETQDAETYRTLLHNPSDWELDARTVWEWLHGQPEARAFLPNEMLPWQSQAIEHGPILAAPILQIDEDHPIGGVYIELQPLSIAWDRHAVDALLPPIQSLSAQVASALHQAHVYADTLAMQKTFQELSLARRIQASFLPETLPRLPGWQLTAMLEPARQMAGDFYDFIPLSDGHLGILIADVADKGLGPALYMALSSTLIRTFATQYPGDPAAVLTAANRRILRDARANLFVTVFYGILDPAEGLLTYTNAGHTPPYLLNPNHGNSLRTLRNTGMPLGIEEEAVWSQEKVCLTPGDVLLLYTDGVTDAQNSHGDFIDRQAVLSAVRQHLEQPVDAIQGAVVNVVHQFVGDAPRFDDITLVILKKD